MMQDEHLSGPGQVPDKRVGSALQFGMSTRTRNGHLKSSETRDGHTKVQEELQHGEKDRDSATGHLGESGQVLIR